MRRVRLLCNGGVQVQARLSIGVGAVVILSIGGVHAYSAAGPGSISPECYSLTPPTSRRLPSKTLSTPKLLEVSFHIRQKIRC